MLILLLLMLLVAFSPNGACACALMAIALLVACVFEGGDWMTMSRFVVPALPALAGGGRRRCWGSARRHRAWPAAAVTMLVVVAAASPPSANGTADAGMRAVALGHERAHGALGRYIARRPAPG
ncbi:MAG: hypothetical protein IPG43_19005 [Proteobacteria bacterium]|nr:hypothetical protein [Pseudomonadota bacterium]